MTEGFANYRGNTYFDNSTKSVTHQQEFAGNLYLINKNKTNWVLTKDTLKIDSYTCYKATTIRTIVNPKGIHDISVIAWYAPSISLAYGPDGFGGLPGLILQLENNGIITTLKKIKFLKDNSITILKPTKGKKLTEDEFNEIARKAYKNIKE